VAARLHAGPAFLSQRSLTVQLLQGTHAAGAAGDGGHVGAGAGAGAGAGTGAGADGGSGAGLLVKGSTPVEVAAYWPHDPLVLRR
jgi:hypothetical protein